MHNIQWIKVQQCFSFPLPLVPFELLAIEKTFEVSLGWLFALFLAYQFSEFVIIFCKTYGLLEYLLVWFWALHSLIVLNLDHIKFKTKLNSRNGHQIISHLRCICATRGIHGREENYSNFASSTFFKQGVLDVQEVGFRGVAITVRWRQDEVRWYHGRWMMTIEW